jgi:hypothetical protein
VAQDFIHASFDFVASGGGDGGSVDDLGGHLGVIIGEEELQANWKALAGKLPDRTAR